MAPKSSLDNHKEGDSLADLQLINSERNLQSKDEDAYNLNQSVALPHLAPFHLRKAGHRNEGSLNPISQSQTLEPEPEDQM